MAIPQLSERAARILSTLVREYIQTGEAVGSSAIARRGGLGLSSATVRHILAELEAEGYVTQPHTSAGRIPTDLGYRSYVDSLLHGYRHSRTATAVEEQLLKTAGSRPLLAEVLTHGSHMLSRVSGNVGFALSPATEAVLFQHIEFVALSPSRVLVVLVTSGGQMSQKIIDIQDAPPPDELHQAANYLNTEFSGMTLLEARTAVLDRLRHERILYNALFARALQMARSALEETPEVQTIFVDGTATLIDETAQGKSAISLETLGAILRMIEEKQRLVRILNEYIDGPGMTVVIGTEHRLPDLHSVSLVAATFFDGHGIGTVGVLGPTRMRYTRAIAVVDGVAQAVSRMLRPRN
jgi:heat-inducible transcriptional repressor